MMNLLCKIFGHKDILIYKVVLKISDVRETFHTMDICSRCWAKYETHVQYNIQLIEWAENRNSSINFITPILGYRFDWDGKLYGPSIIRELYSIARTD